MPTLSRFSSFSCSTSQRYPRGSTQDTRAHRSLSTGQDIPLSLPLRPIDSAPDVTRNGLHSSTTSSPLHSPYRRLTSRSMSTSNAATHSPGLPSPPSSYRRSQVLDSYGVRPRRPSGPPTPREAVGCLLDRSADPQGNADNALEHFRRQLEHLVSQCRRESIVGDEAGHANLVRRLVEMRKYCTEWDELLKAFEERAVTEALQTLAWRLQSGLD